MFALLPLFAPDSLMHTVCQAKLANVKYLLDFCWERAIVRGMNTTNLKKQTAGNNVFLKQVKKVFNVPTFEATKIMLNEQGEAVAREWLQKQVKCPIDEFFNLMLRG